MNKAALVRAKQTEPRFTFHRGQTRRYWRDRQTGLGFYRVKHPGLSSWQWVQFTPPAMPDNPRIPDGPSQESVN